MNLSILPVKVKSEQRHIIQDDYSKLFRCKDGTWSERRGQAELFATEFEAKAVIERVLEAHRAFCEKGL